MKINGILILAGLVLMLFISCNKDDELDPEEPLLTVSADTIMFGSGEDESMLGVSMNGSSWTGVSDQDWCTLSVTSSTKSDEQVSVSVAANTTQEQRKAQLTFTMDEKYTATVVIIQEAADPPLITVSKETLNFTFAESALTLEVNMNGSSWTGTSDQDWCTLSVTSSTESDEQVSVSVAANTAQEQRKAQLTFTMDEKYTVTVEVIQKGGYPDYNTSPLPPDETGMTSTAVELAANMSLGWNVGNSLEASGSETNWGNPRVTEELILLAKNSGFNAIRLPCSWNQYMSDPDKAEISTTWLDRVKEVVQYCVNNDMYVLLNIHWDGGWLERNVTPEKQDENNAKQKAFWQQIATHLRDFDEHLLLASANEPHVENATQMAVLNSYHQTFVDAVRSTGGKNSYRVLVIQGPSTDVQKTNELMTTLPEDEVPDKLMAEVHYYSPYQFCLMTEDESWGKMFYYWGEDNHSTTDTERNPTWGEESWVDEMMGLMKVQFVNKGIPVILGEFGAIKRSALTGEALELHLASRAYYLEYVVRSSLTNGVIPFYWDNGGSDFALFNRNNNTVSDQQALDGLLKGLE